MDEFLLPFVPGTTSLEAAIRILQARSAGALATEQNGRHVVLQASDIADHWNSLVDADKDAAGASIASVLPSVRPTELPAGINFNIDSSIYDDPALRDRLASPFAGHDRQYVIGAVLGGDAKIVTSSETFADILNPGSGAATIVACVGTPVHYWNPRVLRNPARCNKPHGVAIKP